MDNFEQEVKKRIVFLENQIKDRLVLVNNLEVQLTNTKESITSMNGGLLELKQSLELLSKIQLQEKIYQDGEKIGLGQELEDLSNIEGVPTVFEEQDGNQV